MTRTLDLTLRLSLWVLFIATALHAAFIGWVGLTFGFSLWDTQNLSPTLHWLATLAFPVVLFKLLPRGSIELRRTIFVSLGAWAFTGYYVLFYLGDGHILDCGLGWSC